MRENLEILLISNSFSFNKGFLEHCLSEIEKFLSNVRNVLFIPYALKNYDEYEEMAKVAFKKIDKQLISIHHDNPVKMITNSESIFVGGGNTFRLINTLYKNNLLELLRDNIILGKPYIGSSAGAIILTPTIKTTNDMPIVQPPSFASLCVLPFQINPHYYEDKINTKYMFESRRERILQYFEENRIPVLAMKEDSLLLINNNLISVLGHNGVVLFINRNEIQKYNTGELIPNY